MDLSNDLIYAVQHGDTFPPFLCLRVRLAMSLLAYSNAQG